MSSKHFSLSSIIEFDEKCPICRETFPNEYTSTVISTFKYALFFNCNHTFCYDCIHRLRLSYGNTEHARKCPICLKHSYFVIKSTILPHATRDKELMIRAAFNNMYSNRDMDDLELIASIDPHSSIKVKRKRPFYRNYIGYQRRGLLAQSMRGEQVNRYTAAITGERSIRTRLYVSHLL